MLNRIVMLFLLATTVAVAGDAKWVCVKNGKLMEASGANDEERKTDCEARRGKWVKQEKEAEKPAQPQSTGGGGGW